MHSLAVTFSPVLAAEKSKVPFYIAGGLLVVWALVVSLGLGLRDPKFPGNLQGQRTVFAITILLVVAAVATAVLTAGTPEKTVTVTPVHQVSPASTQPLPTGTSSPEPAAGESASSKAPSATTPAATTPAREHPFGHGRHERGGCRRHEHAEAHGEPERAARATTPSSSPRRPARSRSSWRTRRRSNTT